MAAHPPSNPFPPNDGSNVFRRPKSKPPLPASPPADDFAPDEPTDLAELIDDEDAIALPDASDGGPMSSALFDAAPPSDEPISGVLLLDDDTPPLESGSAVQLGDALPVDSGEPISAVLFDDPPPADEPISAVALDDDDLAPPSGPPSVDAILGWTPPASAADSSIFTGGTLPTTGVGSGWLDAPPSGVKSPDAPSGGNVWAEVPPPAGGSKPPSTGKFPDAADLFADLRPDAPESGGEWVETEAHTGRVSDSEVQRAFAATTPDDDAVPDGPLSVADLDLGDDPLATGFLGESGTGLLDRDDITSGPMHVAGAAGSSIFDQPKAPARAFHEDADADDPTDEGRLVFDDELPPAVDRTEVTGRTTLADVDDAEGDPTELEAALFGEADDLTDSSAVPAYRSAHDTFPEPAPALPADEETFTADFLDDLDDNTAARAAVVDARTDDVADAVVEADARPDDTTESRTPAIAAAVAAGAVAGVGVGAMPLAGKKSGAKAPPPKRTKPAVEDDEDEDDRPTRPTRAAATPKKGGIGGILAGVVTGLVVGVAGFSGVYAAGLLPNGSKDTGAKVAPPPADGDQTAKVKALTDELDAAKLAAVNEGKSAAEAKAAERLATERAEKAEGDLKTLPADLAKKQKEVETLTADLKTAKKDAEAEAMKVVDAAKKEAADAKKEFETAKKDLDAAKKDAETAVKLADDNKKALDLAKKDADDQKALVEAEKKAKDAAEVAKLDAEKKAKAADDVLSAVTKELQAAKLLDDGVKVPDAIKKLVTVATSTDAKKAAEAVLAAEKARDDAKTALAKAEAEAKKAALDAVTAKADADKAKTDADKLVADIKKTADDKAKTAVDDATKDLKKQLADTTVAMKKVQDDSAAIVKKAQDDAAANVKKVQDDSAMLVKKAQDDAAAQLATAKTDAEAAAKTKLDAATARADTAEKTLADKVKAVEAKYATELAAARAGAVKLTQPELEAADKATRQYADGLSAYYAGRYADAEASLAAATKNAPADARYWYFLGLARSRAGTEGADDAFKKGADMEARNKPSVKLIDAALERLAFADKQRVNKYRQ